jgi:Fe-Mn family superoxide dismutase
VVYEDGGKLKMAFEQEKLGYEFDALEPYIDAKTMEVHYTKHHAAYTAKFNDAIEGKSNFEGKSAEGIVANWSEAPEDVRSSVRNNGGGYINHALFWEIMKKDVPFEGEVSEAIKEKFGSMEIFKDEFSKAAATQFGSGWAWLVVDKEGNLEVTKSSNQDTPLTHGKTPILGLDVWEHAYYLKYQNRRPEYIENFFKVIDWGKVNELYLAAKSDKSG